MANRAPKKATIQGLRTALSGHFDELETLLRRMREGGLLPRGKPGRGGCGSAQITPRDVAMLLLAASSSSWSTLTNAPQEAERLAALKLQGGDVRVLDVLSGEILAVALDTPAAIQHYAPSSWSFSRHRVQQQALGLNFGDGSADHDGIERGSSSRP